MHFKRHQNRESEEIVTKKETGHNKFNRRGTTLFGEGELSKDSIYLMNTGFEI